MERLASRILLLDMVFPGGLHQRFGLFFPSPFSFQYIRVQCEKFSWVTFVLVVLSRPKKMCFVCWVGVSAVLRILFKRILILEGSMWRETLGQERGLVFG